MATRSHGLSRPGSPSQRFFFLDLFSLFPLSSLRLSDRDDLDDFEDREDFDDFETRWDFDERGGFEEPEERDDEERLDEVRFEKDRSGEDAFDGVRPARFWVARDGLFEDAREGLFVRIFVGALLGDFVGVVRARYRAAVAATEERDDWTRSVDGRRLPERFDERFVERVGGFVRFAVRADPDQFVVRCAGAEGRAALGLERRDSTGRDAAPRTVARASRIFSLVVGRQFGTG